MQIWPWCMNEPNVAAFTACSMSASSRTISASLPPSSTQHFLSSPPALAATCWPTAVEPVKLMPRTVGFEISSSPTAATLSREHVTTLNTPFGMPASSSTSAINRPPETGVSSDGFSTTALPTASATAKPRDDKISGKFQGEIDGDDAERLAHDEAQFAVIGRQDLAVHLIRGRRGGAIDADAVAGLEHRLADPRAAFVDQGFLKFLGARFEHVGGFREQRGALRVRQRGPRRLRRRRGLDRRGGVGAACIRDSPPKPHRSKGCRRGTSLCSSPPTH